MSRKRTTLTMPAELLREVDELVGPRDRSRFIEDALVLKVKRERAGKVNPEAKSSKTP